MRRRWGVVAGYGVSPLCRATMVAAVAAAGLSYAGDDGEEDLRARIRAVEAEIRVLHEGQGAPEAYREYYELEQRIQRLYRENQEKLREPQKRRGELWRDEGHHHHEPAPPPEERDREQHTGEEGQQCLAGWSHGV